MVTVDDVVKYVGTNDVDFAQQCLDEASSLVFAYLGISTGTYNGQPVYYGADIPDNIIDRAILDTASELFARRNAPSGLQEWATTDGVPVRLSRDPMTNSYPLLQKFVVGF